jgi:hypothetical protein
MEQETNTPQEAQEALVASKNDTPAAPEAEIGPTGMEYNTQRAPLRLMEYGRNAQKLTKFISQLPEGEKRLAFTNTLIQVMKQLNPIVRENSDNPQRIWDHLHVMADFNLEVEGAPYPKPEEDVMKQNPKPMAYPQGQVRFRHYGRHVQRMITEALELEDETARKDALVHVGRVMKTFYTSYNNGNVGNEHILHDLEALAKTKTGLAELLAEDANLFDHSTPVKQPSQGRDFSKGGNKKRGNKQGRRSKGGNKRHSNRR